MFNAAAKNSNPSCTRVQLPSRSHTVSLICKGYIKPSISTAGNRQTVFLSSEIPCGYTVRFPPYFLKHPQISNTFSGTHPLFFSKHWWPHCLTSLRKTIIRRELPQTTRTLPTPPPQVSRLLCHTLLLCDAHLSEGRATTMHQAATDGTPEITGSKPCLLPSLLSFSKPATESKNGLGCVRQGPAFNPHPDRTEEEDVGKWLFIPGCKADVILQSISGVHTLPSQMNLVFTSYTKMN